MTIRQITKDDMKEQKLVTYAYQVSRKKDGSLDVVITLGKIRRVLDEGLEVWFVGETIFVPYNRIFSWIDNDMNFIHNSLFNEDEVSKVLEEEGRFGKSQKELELWEGANKKQQEEFKKLMEK